MVPMTSIAGASSESTYREEVRNYRENLARFMGASIEAVCLQREKKREREV